MNRRALLKLSAVAAITRSAASFGIANASQKMRVVIAGAGIVGASIAYHLAKAGVAVSVIDKQGPATHASRGTFAWVNATWAKQPRHYHQFSQQGVANWHDLQRDLNIPIVWGGSLEWFTNIEREQKLAEQIVEQVAWGEPAEMLSLADVAKLEPKLSIPTNSELIEPRVAYSPNDGALDPVLTTERLLKAAEQFGATINYPSELQAVNAVNDRLVSVETSTGLIKADRLVLATGAAPDTAKQFAGIQLPQRTTPGAIAITKPMPSLMNRIIVAPGVHMHQRVDGRVVLGEQEGAPKTAAHAQRLQNRPNEFPSLALAKQHGNRMLDIAKNVIPEITVAEIENAYIGWRPLPIDGHPVIGASPEKPDVYLAVMHSGVSLAPIVGQLVAQELIADEKLAGLENYRPGRDFNTIKRY